MSLELKEVKIVEKKSIGVVPVYDINVPDEHHYILDSGIVSHNSGFIYASSIVVAMKKMKLKEDADGNKISNVTGIRSGCKVMKTRYAKPFEGVEVKIPYDTGMNPYSGLVELFEKKGWLTKSGNRLQYTDPQTGEEVVKFRKAWQNNDEGCLDSVMKQVHLNEVSRIQDDEIQDDEIQDEQPADNGGEV